MKKINDRAIDDLATVLASIDSSQPQQQTDKSVNTI